MAKNNGLIVVVSGLLVGAAGFFIYRSWKSKKDTQKLLEEQGKKKSGEEQGKDVGNIKKVEDNSKELGLGEKVPTKVDTIASMPFKYKNEDNVDSGATRILLSKIGTRLREKPNTTSKILAIVQKANVQLSELPPANRISEGKLTWFYVQQEGTNNKGWVRSDVVKAV